MKDNKMKRKLILIYEFFYEKKRLFKLRLKYHLNIMSPDATIDYIKRTGCSIARYGDGEFDLALNKRDQGFQGRNPELSRKLLDVLSIKNDNLLLCVPRCLNTVKECNNHSKEFWIEWGRKNHHHEEIVDMIRKHAGKKYLFGDAQITRPYIDWKTSKRAERLFPKLKELWKCKDIIIVEGSQTRLGVGNDLFSAALSVKRVLAPAEGAFEHYQDIKNTIIEHWNGELLIMALGPTATILAADFSEMGIQALDIGNIDIEYEWFLRKAKDRIAIPGKYTNEAPDGRTFTECHDSEYEKQIVAKVE